MESGIDQDGLRNILLAQHRVIARGQAHECGLTGKMLEHRLRRGGPWQKLVPGVYLAMTGPASTKQREMAALLHAGPQSALTGLAATRRHGLSGPETGPIDVVVPASVRRQSTGFVRIQHSTRMPREVCLDGKISFVLVARAVADAARNMTSGRELRALVAQAIQRQRCSVALLETELEQGPTAGSAPFRAALAEVRAGVRSVPEGDLRGLLKKERMPMPVFNARLYAGTILIAVADAWWEEAGVVAEVDSRAYHYSAEDWQKTMRRHDRLVAHGVLLLHFTPSQIRAAPEEVAEQIRAALAAGRKRPRLAVTTRRAA